MLRSANNAKTVGTLIAIGRAHLNMPGASIVTAQELAARIDQVCAGTRAVEVTIALVILLMKAIGVTDAADASRLRPQ
jgi:hypothetical protein